MSRITFPHVASPLVRLVPTKVRFQDAVLDDLLERGLSGLPSRDVFTALWPQRLGGVSGQFLILAGDGEEVAGLVSFHHRALNGRHISCSFAVDPSRIDAAALSHAHAFAVNYAFAMWNLRKVNFWTVEDSVPALLAACTEVVCEGTLTEYVLDGGELRDVHVFAVLRDDWDQGGADYVAGLAGGTASG